jgi:hypothetical protein
MTKRHLFTLITFVAVSGMQSLAVQAQSYPAQSKPEVSSTTRDRFKADKCYSTDGMKEIPCEQSKAAISIVQKYPNATRVDPVVPKTKIKKEWDALVKSSNAKDPVTLSTAADNVITNENASNEEKSEAYFQKYVSQITLDSSNYVAMSQYAEAAVKQAGLSNNKHFDLMRNVGLLKINAKKYLEALEYLNRFTNETGVNNDLVVIKNKGNANYRLANYVEAIASLKEAYLIDKGSDPNIAIMLMDSYNKTGKKTEANKIADEVSKSALSADPNDKSGQIKQLLVLANAKQYEKAVKIFDELYAKGQITQLNEYEAGYVSYSYIDGREEQAIKIINEGIDKGIIKPDASVYSILGQSYYYSNNSKGAIDAWKKGAEASSNGDQNLLLAQVLGEESRYVESKVQAQLAISKGIENKGDAYLRIAEAESEFGLNNKTAMIAALREASKYTESKAQALKLLKDAGVK